MIHFMENYISYIVHYFMFIQKTETLNTILSYDNRNLTIKVY